MGRTYRDPTLVLFSGQVPSACGFASAAVGPLLLSARSKGVSRSELLRRPGPAVSRPGEFAQAYVIAHEIGHHVQNQLGISDKVSALQGRVEQGRRQSSFGASGAAGRFSGRPVGPSCPTARHFLEHGGRRGGVCAAATAIGDDRLQRRPRAVMPDSFTHGTSEQRVRWFRRGSSRAASPTATRSTRRSCKVTHLEGQAFA